MRNVQSATCVLSPLFTALEERGREAERQRSRETERQGGREAERQEWGTAVRQRLSPLDLAVGLQVS